jgi:hypothetical protein
LVLFDEASVCHLKSENCGCDNLYHANSRPDVAFHYTFSKTTVARETLEFHIRTALSIIEKNKNKLKTSYLNFTFLERTSLPDILNIFQRFEIHPVLLEVFKQVKINCCVNDEFDDLQKEIKDFCKNEEFPSKDIREAFQSYSYSDRMMNWLFFYDNFSDQQVENFRQNYQAYYEFIDPEECAVKGESSKENMVDLSYRDKNFYAPIKEMPSKQKKIEFMNSLTLLADSMSTNSTKTKKKKKKISAVKQDLAQIPEIGTSNMPDNISELQCKPATIIVSTSQSVKAEEKIDTINFSQKFAEEIEAINSIRSNQGMINENLIHNMESLIGKNNNFLNDFVFKFDVNLSGLVSEPQKSETKQEEKIVSFNAKDILKEEYDIYYEMGRKHALEYHKAAAQRKAQLDKNRVSDTNASAKDIINVKEDVDDSQNLETENDKKKKKRKKKKKSNKMLEESKAMDEFLAEHNIKPTKIDSKPQPIVSQNQRYISSRNAEFDAAELSHLTSSFNATQKLELVMKIQNTKKSFEKEASRLLPLNFKQLVESKLIRI